MIDLSAVGHTAGAPSTDDVVLVHDYLLVMRGAERTFEAISACYPDAPITTLLYDSARTEGRFDHRHVRTSFLQPVAADQRRFRSFLPLFPVAVNRLAVAGARVVRAVRSFTAAARPAARLMLGAVRRWDLRASERVSQFIANSEITRDRIADFYGRDAIVIHPPVDVERFSAEPDPQDYMLAVGEIAAHKNIEIALAACERAGVKLKVVGGGPDLPRLRERFRNAEFLGRVDDRRLVELYSGCRALVVAATEEFGITMVEAHAAGRPVIAAARGGALEIVTGETGVLVSPNSVDEMAEALRATDWEGFDVAVLRANAERFSSTRFQTRFVDTVNATLGLAPQRPGSARKTSHEMVTWPDYPVPDAEIGFAAAGEGSSR